MNTLKGITSFAPTNPYTLEPKTNYEYLSRWEKWEKTQTSNDVYIPTNNKFYMLLAGALRAVKIVECTYNTYDNSYGNKCNGGYFPSWFLVKVAGKEELCIFPLAEILKGYTKKEDYEFGYTRTEVDLGIARSEMTAFLFKKSKKSTEQILLENCDLVYDSRYRIYRLRRYGWDAKACTPTENDADIVLSYSTETTCFTTSRAGYKYRTKEEAIGDNKPIILDFDDEEETKAEETEYTINVSVKVKANKMADAEKIVRDVLKKVEVKGEK